MVEGKFVNIMNEKALDADGYIWIMVDGILTKTEDRVTDIVLLNETVPLFKNIYNNTVMYTYAKCCEIILGDTSIFKETQMLVKNNELYILDGRLANQKDGILIFNKNGTNYMTILGKDGLIVDMYNKDICMPDESYKVKNKAIVNITNNLSATAPYAIIKYANGGIIGYNYLSGEVLFDKRVKDQVSILDYAGEYYSDNDISMYANISNTYKTNLSLLSTLENPEEIDNILNGSTSLIPNTNIEIEGATTDTSVSGSEINKPVGKPEIETEVDEEDTDVNAAISNRKFMAVYDVEKGAYTIVYVDNYIVNPEYKSENDRVGVDNLASVIKGNIATAETAKDNQATQGMWIYIIAATLLVAGVATFVPVMRKNLKYKRR